MFFLLTLFVGAEPISELIGSRNVCKNSLLSVVPHSVIQHISNGFAIVHTMVGVNSCTSSS